jgi:hypothetical protein
MNQQPSTMLANVDPSDAYFQSKDIRKDMALQKVSHRNHINNNITQQFQTVALARRDNSRNSKDRAQESNYSDA